MLRRFLITTLMTSSVAYGQANCQNMQSLYEKAELDAYSEMPEGLIQTSKTVDLSKTQICEQDGELSIETEDVNAQAQHLVAAGLYLGHGLLGVDATYTRLKTKW